MSIHRLAYILHGLTVLDDETTEWLPTPAPKSSAAKQWIEEGGHIGSLND